MTATYLSIGLDKLDAQDGNVVAGSTVPSNDFYFQILTTTFKPTKKQAIKALKQFERYLLSNGVSAGQAGVNLPVL